MNTDMPDEVMELMSLYPQPVRHLGGVEYLPVPRQKGAGRCRRREAMRTDMPGDNGDSVHPKINNNVSGKLALHTSPEALRTVTTGVGDLLALVDRPHSPADDGVGERDEAQHHLRHLRPRNLGENCARKGVLLNN